MARGSGRADPLHGCASLGRGELGPARGDAEPLQGAGGVGWAGHGWGAYRSPRRMRSPRLRSSPGHAGSIAILMTGIGPSAVCAHTRTTAALAGTSCPSTPSAQPLTGYTDPPAAMIASRAGIVDRPNTVVVVVVMFRFTSPGPSLRRANLRIIVALRQPISLCLFCIAGWHAISCITNRANRCIQFLR